MSEHSAVVPPLSAPSRSLLSLDGPGVRLWRQRQHLLDVDDLQDSELETLLEATRICQKIILNHEPPLPFLSNRVIANLFYENSTRTRSSFELAAKRLSATVLNLDIASSSAAKGETMADTGKTLLAMGVHAIIQRHHASGSAQQIAQVLGNDMCIINAGDGWHAHPTQALLDYFTIQEIRPQISGLKIAIIGDITHSRVAGSNIRLLKRLGADIHVAGPPTMVPAHMDKLGVQVHDRLVPAIEKADFIMVLRLQLERQKQGLIPSIDEYKKIYRLDSGKLILASPSVRILHPGPMNRDIEITHELAENKDKCLVLRQVSNGAALRMAVLYLLLSKETGK